MLKAAIKSKRPQPKAAARSKTNPDGTPKFGLHEGHCFYCNEKGHTKTDRTMFKALLEKNAAANSDGTPVSDQGRQTVDGRCDELPHTIDKKSIE